MKTVAKSPNSQWALAATICPSKRKLETILEKRGIRKGSGAGSYDGNYAEAKYAIIRLYNLSGQEYDKAIKIITDYLKM